MNKPTEPKYSKAEGCPFCKNKQFTRLRKDFESNVKCDKCGAIFYNEELSDHEKAGDFTGMYAPITRESLYEFSFAKENKEKPKEETKE